uniref:Secreted protein n=1 Tax=Populus alba TaxID=43335 RepID=A0A4U5P628_POPAL|nr:hypothetical protein D5086_0000226720 [Populus alba]
METVLSLFTNLILQLLAFNASSSSVLACKYVDSTRFSVLSCMMQCEHFDSLSQGLIAEVILDDAIVRLKPDFFLSGGGENTNPNRFYKNDERSNTARVLAVSMEPGGEGSQS